MVVVVVVVVVVVKFEPALPIHVRGSDVPHSKKLIHNKSLPRAARSNDNRICGSLAHRDAESHTMHVKFSLDREGPTDAAAHFVSLSPERH